MIGSDMNVPPPRLAGRLRRALGFLALGAYLVLPGRVLAGETIKEYWPEIDIWANLPQIRLSSYISLSKNVETMYREGSLLVQADHAWKRKRSRFLLQRLADEPKAAEMKPYMLRGGLIFGRSIGDNGEEFSEQSGLLEFHLRIPLQGCILLSNRIRTDLRFLGETNDFSWRLRYRLMVEREFAVLGASVVPYISTEPYYDSRDSAINRVRSIAGSTVALSTRFAVEANVTYQFDPQTWDSRLVALNTILHVYF